MMRIGLKHNLTSQSKLVKPVDVQRCRISVVPHYRVESGERAAREIALFLDDDSGKARDEKETAGMPQIRIEAIVETCLTRLFAATLACVWASGSVGLVH